MPGEERGRERRGWKRRGGRKEHPSVNSVYALKADVGVSQRNIDFFDDISSPGCSWKES